jgi:acetyl esterase/lipase
MQQGLVSKRAAEERRRLIESERKAEKEAKREKEAAERAADASKRLLEEARATTSGVNVEWDVACPGRTGVVCCDIWTSSTSIGAPQVHPVVLWLHGGGWRHGTHHVMPEFMRVLTDAGFAVVSVGYQKREPFPANLDDCKTVARWVRSEGAARGLDGRRIGVIGSSAGAHLAALLGLTGDVESGIPLVGAEGGDSQRSSAVQAVVAIAGPYDLRSRCRSDDPKSHEAHLLGGRLDAQPPERVDAASPLSHAKALRPASIVPAFLLIHGDQDAEVPIEQSQLLLAALASAPGSTARADTLVTVRGGTHMLFSGRAKHNETQSETQVEWDLAMRESTLKFLDAHLRGPLPA